MPLRLSQPEGIDLAIWAHHPAFAQVTDDFVGVNRIMVHQPVEQRASRHQAVWEGATGLHIPLTWVEAGDPLQDHLLVLPSGDPVRWPGKGEGLPLRPCSRGRWGCWSPGHTQEQEERQGKGEYALNLA